MKKLFLILFVFGSFYIGHSQFLNFGIKGGVNYNSNGDLRSLGTESISISSDGDTGYHFGVLAEIKLPLWIYIRPELLYTKTQSGYSFEGETAKLSIEKIDVPLLVGFRVLGIGRFFLGPSFQYVLNTKLSDLDLENSDDFTVGAQLGIGLEFGKFGVDVRGELGLSDSEARFVGDLDDIFTVDTRPQQVIFSLYYKFK